MSKGRKYTIKVLFDPNSILRIRSFPVQDKQWERFERAHLFLYSGICWQDQNLCYNLYSGTHACNIGILCQLLNLFGFSIFIIMIAGANICNKQALWTHPSFPFASAISFSHGILQAQKFPHSSKTISISYQLRPETHRLCGGVCHHVLNVSCLSRSHAFDQRICPAVHSEDREKQQVCFPSGGGGGNKYCVEALEGPFSVRSLMLV